MTANKAVHQPLPLEIGQIDCDWLTRALSERAPGVVVEDAEIVDINHGTCTKIRLKLGTNEAGRRAGIPGSVILKGGFEPHSRDMYQTMRNEVHGYRDLFPEYPLPTPRCFFADETPHQLQGIVIMEDLVARGVTFCSPLQPQGFEAVARRLGVLAGFHALTWDSTEFERGGRLEWAQGMLEQSREYLPHHLRPEVLEHFLSEPRGAAASVAFHDSDWLIRSVEALPRIAQALPRCVVHGDTHLGNLYVDPDGTPGFFDPQPHRGPSMAEVTYHLACALDPADRREWERPLIAHYLEVLAGSGVDVLSLEEAMHYYAAFLVIGFSVFLVNASHFQPESVNTACTARFSAAMLDNNTRGILRECGV